MKFSRLVRVFISSTFRDFIEERDELVKKVFPELRRRCKERFVEVLEVDLRWGITEEQSKSGETLRICLEEIDRCRPSAPVFFVGLLGERYGWIPPRDYFKPDVLEDPNLSWVKEHIDGKSVTELEILHGVLRNETMRDKSFFYFRNDGYQERHWAAIASHHKGILPPLTKEDFTNSKSPTPEADAARQRDLKQRVRDVSFKWDPKDYETPQNLASLILEDLWAAINEVFPASSVPDALERESLEHRVFMDSRTRAYVERDGLFEKLDAFANAPERDSLEEPPDQNQAEQSEDADAQTKEKKQPPSVRLVLGESGSGKSALLAAWLAKRETVFFHFTGATPTSVSGSSMLRRLLATLRKRGVVPISESIPQSDEAMAQILPTWLEKLSAQGGGIILFDAVNQLASARDRELWWWPEEWPANIRVIFSTLPGDSLREMARRGWTGAQSDSNTYTWDGKSVTTYTTKTTANYIANYRAVMTSSSQIAGGRRIELTDSQSAFSTEGYPAAPDPYPMIAKMRNNAANQIFASLHPSVLKIRRVIDGTKSESAKQAIRLANAGLWLEAVAAAQNGVQEMPADPEARYILAIVYQGTGRYADADKVLRELVGMSPKSKYANAIRENQAVWHNAARFQQQM